MLKSCNSTAYETLITNLATRYSNPIGGNENPSGFAPVFIDGSFPTGIVETSTGKKEIKATALSALSPKNLKTVNLVQIIQSGRLACATYKEGLMKELHVHPYWFQIIENENAWELILKTDEESGHVYLEENDDIGIAKMNDESYLNMVDELGFAALIND